MNPYPQKPWYVATRENDAWVRVSGFYHWPDIAIRHMNTLAATKPAEYTILHSRGLAAW